MLKRDFLAVVTDIEGTTTPITFVHDILFPYIKQHLRSFLVENWGNAELIEHLKALHAYSLSTCVPVQSFTSSTLSKSDEIAFNTDKKHTDKVNTLNKSGNVVEIAESTQQQLLIQSIMDHVEWQMSLDLKTRELKGLQGFIWKSAYEHGLIKGDVYDDAVEAIQRWNDQKLPVYIYSSGSVQAQKLLFKYSTHGDLLHLFSDHFDTEIGPKTETLSYLRISETIQVEPDRILFLSDNHKEISAALQAGYQCLLAVRPGNQAVPLDKIDQSYVFQEKLVRCIESFNEI